MKTLISENAGYRVFVEVNKAMAPANTYEVKVTSEWAHANNPESQTKFRLILNAAQLQTFKDSLSYNG